MNNDKTMGKRSALFVCINCSRPYKLFVKRSFNFELGHFPYSDHLHFMNVNERTDKLFGRIKALEASTK